MVFWVLLLPNLALLYLALFLAMRVRYPAGMSPEILSAHLWAFSWIFILWILNFFIHGIFDTSFFRRYLGLVFRLATAQVVNLLIAILFFYFQKDLILTPRRFLLVVLAISFALLLVWNLLVKFFLKNRIKENIFLFSFNQELLDLEKEIENHEFLGYKVLGHLNANNLASASIGQSSAIVLPDKLDENKAVLKDFFHLRTRGVSFYNHRDFYEQLLRRIYLSDLSEVWFLQNINYREKRLFNFLKRLVDLFFGLLSGLVFVLIFPFIYLLIKIFSPGPVFFTQERVGKNGEVFKVYKFRSMKHGSPTNTWTKVADPRITPLGRFLRKSRIDEIPQFLNLLFGNMSLVGPRPEQPQIVERLRKDIPFYDERHLVKPGLTGWAQINNIYAGNDEETKLKLQYDLYYIKNRSLLFDLEIILKTLYYIFTWQGR